ncbi:Frag1/DRAM/Sfk1 [Microdochium bolleyi]|uniref:Frag1/DRAM/Sfk1 n=1 Tax=Microdochium bolleyi TaxID=196109 RepID=A0A136INN5_9PEZI|nr:Frag1/DRAM/Sfk1 [Microdochium bolleyi]
MSRKPASSYWVVPIVAGLIWLATLLALLLYWLVDTSSTYYPSMSPRQTIAFISDVGASTLKPLFVVGCVLTTLLLGVTLYLDAHLRRRRWRPFPSGQRHWRKLLLRTYDGSRTQRVLSRLTLASAGLGAAGLCLLSGFDTARYEALHRVFLLVFIVGYLASAICICWQYQRLGKQYRIEQPSLRLSFYMKLAFVLVEFVLAVAFVALLFYGRHDAAAVLEWILALVFALYVMSFAIDLYPAAYRGGADPEPDRDASCGAAEGRTTTDVAAHLEGGEEKNQPAGEGS